MKKAILFAPSDETIDASLHARDYVERLSRRLDLETRPYDDAGLRHVVCGAAASVAVLAGLSALKPESGYMEVQLDTLFEAQELLKKLREELPEDFPIVAVVDDAYSYYVMGSYLKAGASAVVGTSGDLFGVVVSRLRGLEQLFPYINAFERL